MKPELTKAQQILFDAIKGFIENNHYPPSIQELCAITKKKSTYGVRKLLDEIEKKEYIVKLEGMHRSIRIV